MQITRSLTGNVSADVSAIIHQKTEIQTWNKQDFQRVLQLEHIPESCTCFSCISSHHESLRGRWAHFLCCFWPFREEDETGRCCTCASSRTVCRRAAHRWYENRLLNAATIWQLRSVWLQSWAGNRYSDDSRLSFTQSFLLSFLSPEGCKW